MTTQALIDLARQALLTGVLVSLPVAGAVALVGVLVGALQSVTQIHDPALVQLPRLLVVALVLGALGPWMGEHVVRLLLQALGGS